MQCARLKSAIKPVNLIGNATSSVFQLKTQALMGATRPASVFSVVLSREKGCSYYLVEFVFYSFLYPSLSRRGTRRPH